MTQATSVPAMGVPAAASILHRLLVVVALGVSLLFLYSGVEKWSDIGQFERIVVSHGLIGQAWAGLAGMSLAGAEVSVGIAGLALVLLAWPRALAPMLVAQATLFLGLAVYAGMLAAKPPAEPTSCGCGVLSAPIADWPGILTRNAVTAAALGGGALVAARLRRGIEPW